jgi:mannose-6-phosphate isomerase-like protein (cupin superfamily)
MPEYVQRGGQILAIIIRRSYTNSGIEFFTPDGFSQQLAYMSHPAGKNIQPHVHNIVKREVLYTKEVLFIRKGKIRADFYTDDREYVCSRILKAGDVMLLASGGHGFEMLEDTEMFEVKQGPYAGENDKTRFNGVNKEDIRITDAE